MLDQEACWLGSICVSLFLFISGYGLGAKEISIKNFPSKVTSRLRSFYAFFISSALLLFILVAIFSRHPLHEGIVRRFQDIGTLLANLTLVWTDLNYNWWFGRCYVLCLILIWPILIITTKPWPFKCLLISLVLSLLSQNLDQGIFTELFRWQSCFAIGYILSASPEAARIARPLLFPNDNAGNVSRIATSLLRILFVVLLRRHIGSQIADSILAPILIFALLELRLPLASKVLTVLGGLSGYMWLNHSFLFVYIWPDFFHSYTNPIAAFLLLCSASALLAIPCLGLNYAIGRLTSKSVIE
jgi:hypothetical protein